LRDSDGLKGRPRPTPKGLPPPLNSQLTLDNVTAHWENAPEPKCRSVDQGARCPVSWVSGFSSAREPEKVMEYFEPYIVQPVGWELRDERKVKKAAKKYGFSPNSTTTPADDVLTFQFDLEQDIQTLAVFFLQSYGPKWDNSTALISIVNEKQETATTHEIYGVHDKETSEMYSEEVAFPEPLRKFKVEFKHTAGETFKLMGLAVCS
jgi:hypothetical protein